VAYTDVMKVRDKEGQAEGLAKILDNALSIPGFHARVGIDPLIGLFPIVGDVIVTIGGAAILVFARQLQVPWDIQLRMAYNLFKNGLVGAVPFIGDLYSFRFKCHQLNAALLVRSVKRGEDGKCLLQTQPLTMADMMTLALLIVPTILLVLATGIWFWDRNVSLLTLLYPPLYQSRTE
jgi:Domain of unknown function (DUF4112)